MQITISTKKFNSYEIKYFFIDIFRYIINNSMVMTIYDIFFILFGSTKTKVVAKYKSIEDINIGISLEQIAKKTSMG